MEQVVVLYEDGEGGIRVYVVAADERLRYELAGCHLVFMGDENCDGDRATFIRLLPQLKGVELIYDSTAIGLAQSNPGYLPKGEYRIIHTGIVREG